MVEVSVFIVGSLTALEAFLCFSGARLTSEANLGVMVIVDTFWSTTCHL